MQSLSDNSIPEDRHIGPIENTPLKRPTVASIRSGVELQRWCNPKRSRATVGWVQACNAIKEEKMHQSLEFPRHRK